MIREFAKSSPAAYRVWASWRNRISGPSLLLPDSRHDLYLDGFPRSGNTYFTAAVHSAFPDCRFANHLHVVAPIKIALRVGLPVFILVRNPEDSIASYILHVQNETSLSSYKKMGVGQLIPIFIREWLVYYSFVWEQRYRITPIVSEAAFSDPVRVLQLISNQIARPTSTLEATWRRFHDGFQRRDSTKSQGSTSYPDDRRAREKLALKAAIRRDSGLSACKDLYGSIENEVRKNLSART